MTFDILGGTKKLGFVTMLQWPPIYFHLLSSLLFMERLGCLLRNLNTPMNFKIYISNEFIEIHSLDDKSFEIKLAWRLEFSNPFQDAKSREVLKRSF